MGIGGSYDTNPGSISGTGEQDVGLALKAGLGYQLPLDGHIGFRVDYTGYADFHRERSEFDLQEHQVAIEPQYTFGQFVLSLQLGGTRIFEDGRHDADSIAISPAVTRLLNSGTEAIAVYGHAAEIEDKDDVTPLNEDRRTFGAGASYFFTSGDNSSAMISVDYTKVDFSTAAEDFNSAAESIGRRSDRVVNARLDIFSRLASHMGLYATYSYIRNRSNIASYDYQRHILEAGISLLY